MESVNDLSWHEMTSAENKGTGYDVLLDVEPGSVCDQAAEYFCGAIVRTAKPGWTWWARCPGDLKSFNEAGEADTKEEALANGLRALDRYRRKQELVVSR